MGNVLERHSHPGEYPESFLSFYVHTALLPKTLDVGAKLLQLPEIPPCDNVSRTHGSSLDLYNILCGVGLVTKFDSLDEYCRSRKHQNG